MFEGLNAIPWAELSHAYGSAEEVPVWLRQLTSDDEQVRHRAMDKLRSSIYHQGSLYPATAYAVPYLIALLQEPTVQGKEAILGLLNAIVNTDPLDEQMWSEYMGAWGGMSGHIPYQDCHAAIEAAIPVYIALLEAPVLILRLEAANILTRFPERTRELWPVLQAALEREPTEAGRADLVLALGRLARHLPEKQEFFLGRFQTDQSELGVFAAALVVLRMAKETTPEEVAQFLIRVMLQPPSSLDLYLRLPCGGTYPWSTSLWALANLGRVRLTPLVPEVVEHLQQIRNTYGALALFARLVLFIVFDDHPERGRPSWAAEALTEDQRRLLLLLLEQEQIWNDGNLLSLFRAYGLPGDRKKMAAYLGQEAPVETPREPLSKPQRPSQFDLYRETIQAIYPQLSLGWWGEKIQIGEGADDFLTFNKNVLFRFPRGIQAHEEIEREVALLRALQGRLPLPIPNPLYASQGVPEAGRAFIGYVLPPGKLLAKEMLESVDEEETVQGLAEQLAAFLSALHHLPVAELAHLSVPVPFNREGLEALYVRAQEELFPQMPPDQRAYITAHFEALLATPDHFAVTPVLLHGNVGPETIIYDAKEHRISGVIDFSRACLGDPALDFARLIGPRGYGEAFLQRWVSVYPELPSLLERASFYSVVVALEEELRKRDVPEQKVPAASQFPEIDRIFYESSKLWEGEGETPLLSYYFA
jgi:aminoglycoside 2''-phosphotransferase